jgi:hypothetical protein
MIKNEVLAKLKDFQKENKNPRFIEDNRKEKRFVMCKVTWPENNYADFVVFAVRLEESDDQAIERAGAEYSPKIIFTSNNTFLNIFYEVF